MTFHSGFNGAAGINGTTLAVVEWSVTPTAQTVDFKNSKSGGYTIREATFKEAKFTIKVDYDFDANPFAVSSGVTIGTTISSVSLYLDGTSGPCWAFPSAIVTSTPQRLAVDGKITTTLQCASSGSFSYPT